MTELKQIRTQLIQNLPSNFYTEFIKALSKHNKIIIPLKKYEHRTQVIDELLKRLFCKSKNNTRQIKVITRKIFEIIENFLLKDVSRFQILKRYIFSSDIPTIAKLFTIAVWSKNSTRQEIVDGLAKIIKQNYSCPHR